MTQDQNEEQQELAEILEPLIEETLNMWDDLNDADATVVADNLATALIEQGIIPPPAGRPVNDVPTGEML